MSYVYIPCSRDNDEWTAGFFMPDGTFFRESKHDSPEAAARRVNYLNGGAPDIHMTVRRLHANADTFQKLRFLPESKQ